MQIHRFSHNKVWVVLSFKDHKDCLRAISANGQYIGDRFLEMFPLFYSSDVHEQLLAEEGVDDDTEGEEMK